MALGLAGPWPGHGWRLAWPWLAFGLALGLALGVAIGLFLDDWIDWNRTDQTDSTGLARTGPDQKGPQ